MKYRPDVVDGLRNLAHMAESRGCVGPASLLFEAAKESEKPYNKYSQLLTEWYNRLNNAPKGSPEEWLAGAMRRYLPIAHRKTYRKDPSDFAHKIKNGLSAIKEEADFAETRKGLFMKFMKHALKVQEGLD